MHTSHLCMMNKMIGMEVRDFIKNVPSVKEESITDYLVWRWQAVDPRFKYVHLTTFTRQQECTTTGADFEMELWIVGRKLTVPLLFQAKKFVKPHDGYKYKLRYPDNTKDQLKTLLQYATKNRLMPFYAVYTDGSHSSPSMCKAFGSQSESGLYMIHADIVDQFCNGVYGRIVLLDDLLSKSNPFHCMFCCPLGPNPDYFNTYFNTSLGRDVARNSNDIPIYVRALLTSESGEAATEDPASPGEDRLLLRPRLIGVYDLRDEE